MWLPRPDGLHQRRRGLRCGWLAAAVAAVILIGCSSDTTTPTEHSTRTGRPTPSVQPTDRSFPPIVDPPEGTAVADDSAGDLVNDADEDVAGPAYVDVLSLHAVASPNQLTISLDIAGRAPAVDPSVEELTYLVMIDTDAAEEPDYWLTAENRSTGRFTAVLTDWAANTQYELDDAEFTGGVGFDGDTLNLQVHRDDLGNPSSLRVLVWTQQYVGGVVTAKDYVPDAAAAETGAPDEWTVVLP